MRRAGALVSFETLMGRIGIGHRRECEPAGGQRGASPTGPTGRATQHQTVPQVTH